VEIFSNCDTVELLQNGGSLGMRRREAAGGFVWDVRFESGVNRLEARGTKGGMRVVDSAEIAAVIQPPAPEPRLAPAPGGAVRIEWTAIEGATGYAVYAGETPSFEPAADRRLAVVAGTAFTATPDHRGKYYRVAATAGGGEGHASRAVGWAPGALEWRWVNSGWLFSSPAIADLDGDGQAEIVFGSYNGSVYALGAAGREVWRFDTGAGSTVIASPVGAPLAPGERPSIVVNSDRALYVLGADGRLRWKRDGVRQFDRSTKSPALGDLDGDGKLEIVVASDTGELLALDRGGRLLWRYVTAAAGNRGLSLTTPVLVASGGRVLAIAFGADDGCTHVLQPDGRLRWKFDHRLEGATPGLPPNGMTPAAGPLEEGGPPRIVTGAGHLRVFDLEGRLVWERADLRGMPQISALRGDRSRQVVVADGAALKVLDGAGRDVWRYALENARDFFTQAPASTDVDGDGRPDLIAGTRATWLYAVSSEGKLLWRFQTDDELSGSPAVADLRGDGHRQVIFGSRDGWLYVLGAGPQPARDNSSREYRGDRGRSANYAPAPNGPAQP
jgi:hypothetical protein